MVKPKRRRCTEGKREHTQGHNASLMNLRHLEHAEIAKHFQTYMERVEFGHYIARDLGSQHTQSMRNEVTSRDERTHVQTRLPNVQGCFFSAILVPENFGTRHC